MRHMLKSKKSKVIAMKVSRLKKKKKYLLSP